MNYALCEIDSVTRRVVNRYMPIKFKEIFRKLISDKFANNASAAARAIGLKQQQISNYLSEKEKDVPRLDSAAVIADHFRMTLDELTGRKPLLRVLPTSVVVRASSLKSLPDLPERRTELVEVPIVSGAIAAGAGRIPDDIVEDWAWLPVSQLHGHSRENLVCVKITGESMEPIIRTGAIVCVDRAVRPTGKKNIDRSIYAVRTGVEGVSVKYVRITDHIMALLSANLEQAPIMVDLRAQPSPLIGRVIWMWQSME